MKKSLESFLADLSAAVSPSPTSAEKKVLCVLISSYLKDDEFRESFANLCTDSRRLVFEDPRSGICLVAHRFEGSKIGDPHDHGSTWSIYAQVTGVTRMTHYRVIKPATMSEAGLVRPDTEITLRPGDSYLYDLGDVHSPGRDRTTQLLRVEGINMDGMSRMKYTAI